MSPIAEPEPPQRSTGTSTRPAALRVGLIGQYGSGNLGDVAIQRAMVMNVLARVPDAHFVGISGNPKDTRAFLDVDAFPLDPENREGSTRGRIGGRIRRTISRAIDRARHLRQSWRLLRSLDLLVASGGGQLDEFWGGPWGYPFTLWRWTLLARWAGCPVAFVSVGKCDLKSAMGQRFVRGALSRARYRSFRDEQTLHAVEALGVRGPNSVVPDLAFSLPLPDDRERHPGGSALTVGFSPIDARCWTTEDDPTYHTYRHAFTQLAAQAARCGHEVVLFPSSLSMDARLLPAIEGAVRAEAGADAAIRVRCAVVGSIEDLLATLAETDIVVASRLHGVILSHIFARPVLALSYHPKVTIHMSEIGQAAYCIEMGDIEITHLRESLRRIEETRTDIRHHLQLEIERARADLDAQYDRIVDLCNPSGVPGT